MGFFDFLKKKEEKKEDTDPAQSKRLTTDVEFKQMEKGTVFTLENQDGPITVECDENLYDYIEIMLDDPDQFVVLSAPEAIADIRYVQACLVEDGIEVQLGIEEGTVTKLYSKRCSEAELEEIFTAFYHGEFVPDRTEYQPVEFYC